MDHSFDHSVFSKNKERLLDADVAREFLLAIVEQAREQRLLSEEHFSVDGTLLEAWASVKSSDPGMKTRRRGTVRETAAGDAIGSGLSGGAAPQRNPPVHHGPGGSAGQKG